MLESFKLSIPDVPFSYEGPLYFILGPGLGDTVNGFRLLHEVQTLYPHATLIVYADPRWKALYNLLPERDRCSWRYHVAAPSGELAGKTKEPSYSETIRGVEHEIRSEIERTSGFVVMAGYTCLDQLARKELGLATKARFIGLPLSKERCRPFLPLASLPLDDIYTFLDRQGLQPERFIAMAPQTWADKAWPPSCWQQLMQGLYEETGLPTVVLGLKGFEVLDAPGMHQALGLSLEHVAGLISQARCFVGLDSGLTHMAACFDVPIVGLQAQGKFPPFLIEPHSPFRRIHLTPLVYGRQTIPSKSVHVCVRSALLSAESPVCPLCDEVPYVLGASADQTAYLCRCGLIYRVLINQDNASAGLHPENGEATLPARCQELVLFKKKLRRKSAEYVSDQKRSPVSYAFEHWNSRETSSECILSDKTNRELWWSWDAANHLVTSQGWHIIESHGTSNSGKKGKLFSFVVTIRPDQVEDHDAMLHVPWGQDLVRLKRSLYERWLCWESFERANELEDLGWRLVKEGFERDGRDILRFAAKRAWRGRTLSRLLRSEWKALGTGMKNSQDAPVLT